MSFCFHDDDEKQMINNGKKEQKKIVITQIQTSFFTHLHTMQKRPWIIFLLLFTIELRAILREKYVMQIMYETWRWCSSRVRTE